MQKKKNQTNIQTKQQNDNSRKILRQDQIVQALA